MEKYVVYMHRLPNRRVSYKTIHKTSCRYAKKPNEETWIGPFDSVADAEALSVRVHQESDSIKLCKICKPVLL